MSNYNYTVKQDSRSAELCIDPGKGCGEENKALFDQLQQNKAAIKAVFGEPLKWESLEGKRCRVIPELDDRDSITRVGDVLRISATTCVAIACSFVKYSTQSPSG